MSQVLYQQTGHKHKYLNLVIENNTLSISPAIGKVDRGEDIIENPENYLLSIDRYFIKSCIIPVYSSLGNPMKFTLEYGGNLYSSTVTHNKQFYYTLHEVKERMNIALSEAIGLLNTGEGTAYTAPEFEFGDNLWSFNSAGSFKDDVSVYFNYPAYLLMNTFEFSSIDPTSMDQVAQLYQDEDTIIQRIQTLEKWIPLSKVVVRSDLPIVDEFTPDRGSNLSYSKSSESILTDYVLFANDSSACLSVEYSAGGNHRYISFDNANKLNEFTLVFEWQDKAGNSYELILPPEDLIEMKLLFKEDSVKMVVPE